MTRVEKARLEQALAQVAARLESFESGQPVVSVDEVTTDCLAPLGLSPRESEVLLWVLRGKTNPEIAIILGCGAETVKTHLKRIFRQLDVTTRAAAAGLAMERMVPAASPARNMSPPGSPQNPAIPRRRPASSGKTASAQPARRPQLFRT